MAAGPKLVADRTEHGTEASSVPQTLESLQASLTPADGLARSLDSVGCEKSAEARRIIHDGFGAGHLGRVASRDADALQFLVLTVLAGLNRQQKI
jgi:hypothetical protein